MKILFVDSTLRENSRTLFLAKKYLEKLDGQINRLILADSKVKPLNKQSLAKDGQDVENKDYIVQLVNVVAKTMVEAFENLKIEDANMFQLGYNKAIDDFVESVKNLIADSSVIRFKDIDEIAEQLKEGEKNE